MAPCGPVAGDREGVGGVVEAEAVRDQRGRDLGMGGEDPDRGVELALDRAPRRT